VEIVFREWLVFAIVIMDILEIGVSLLLHFVRTIRVEHMARVVFLVIRLSVNATPDGLIPSVMSMSMIATQIPAKTEGPVWISSMISLVFAATSTAVLTVK